MTYPVATSDVSSETEKDDDDEKKKKKPHSDDIENERMDDEPAPDDSPRLIRAGAYYIAR